MSITPSFLQSFKIDKRLSYGAAAGYVVGCLIEAIASERIMKATNSVNFNEKIVSRTDFKKNSELNRNINTKDSWVRNFSYFAAIGAVSAVHYESSKLAGVSIACMACCFWNIYQINVINSQQDTPEIQKKIEKALTWSFTGLISMVAVPVAAFAWQVAQSMRKS